MDRPIKYLAPLKVTRERANEILDNWRAGAQTFTSDVISLALLASGDLDYRRSQQREWIGTVTFEQ